MEKNSNTKGTYRNRRVLGLLAFLLLAGSTYAVGVRYFGIASWTAKEIPASPTGLRFAPAFSLPDSSGKTRTLEEFRGKVVLLHFWATWCPPCLNEMPELIEMAKAFPSTDLRILTVSLDGSWEDARRILPDKILPSNLVSLLDLSREVPDRFGSYQYPETYLLNRDLKIVHKFVGAQAWTGDEMMKLFKKLF